MKKLYYIVILCMIISTNFISAQTFYLASTIDSTYAQYSNVENTGNDAVQYSNSGLDMKVMVWDEDNPTFYWRLADEATIDLSMYRSGMYIFILRTGDKTETFKVLKK